MWTVTTGTKAFYYHSSKSQMSMVTFRVHTAPVSPDSISSASKSLPDDLWVVQTTWTWLNACWSQVVSDATLKQVHIINEAAWYCLVQYIPLRRHTGRVRQGGSRLVVHIILFRGKIFMPYLPKESLQYGSDYIAAFGLKCPKPRCCCVNMFCLMR